MTTAKPAININQPPISEEILLNHFPKKHSKFLKKRESLQTQIDTCSENYYWIKDDPDLPEEAKSILKDSWK